MALLDAAPDGPRRERRPPVTSPAPLTEAGQPTLFGGFTPSDVEDRHQRFQDHTRACATCHPSPVIGPCQEGQALADARDAAARAFMEAAIALVPGVRLTGRSQGRNAHFAFAEHGLGGVAYSPFDRYRPKYRVIVGIAESCHFRDGCDRYCEADDISTTVRYLCDHLTSSLSLPASKETPDAR